MCFRVGRCMRETFLYCTPVGLKALHLVEFAGMCADELLWEVTV